MGREDGSKYVPMLSEDAGGQMKLTLVLYVTMAACLVYISANATPYWDESDFERSQAGPFLRHVEKRDLPSRTVLGYSYPHELGEIAEFLSVWQVRDTLSPHFGGMREGECCGLENIIETDNTQESIWIWCRFGQITGDTSTYRPSIDAAWDYVAQYPAYNEEGSDSPYYRIHNCGWALVAYEAFKMTYGDSSRMAYADSCADYVVSRKDSLTFDDFNFYGRLHPMVAGWAAGTLYRYGLSRGSPDYVDTALAIGFRVADWVDSSSSVRLSDEVWAMSSGTAMWGIVNSVVEADPPAWNAWLTTYAESLQFYEDASNWNDWNNSWNIWYANAFGSIGRILADAQYSTFHRILTDTLLNQDTDTDGGVPANTMHPDTMDQTWVSCYLGMMGIEGLMDSLPLHDVGPEAFISPSTSAVIPVGDSVPIVVTALNYGLGAESSVPIAVSGDFSGSEVVELPVASVDTAYFSGFWVPSVDSVFELTAYTDLFSDEDRSNDTLRLPVTVLPIVAVTGSVRDSISGSGVDSWLYFTRLGPPADTLWDSTSTDVLGNFSVDLVTGTYELDVRPAIPYPARLLSGITVYKDSAVTIDIELGPATLLVMDDDEGRGYEDYYTSVLDTIGVSYICWDVLTEGPFAMSLASLFASPIIIWFTGDEVTNTLTSADRESLSTFLDSGGNLFITGQNIGQDLDTTSFYSDYLRAALVLPTTNDHTLDGVAGDPIGDGLQVLTAGSPGAGNQVSQDVIAPLAGADSVLLYNPVDCAGAKYDSGTYKVVYFGFGFEGVASRPEQGYVTSWYLMRRVLAWFDPTIVPVMEDPVAEILTPGRRYSLSASPNPFSTDVGITFQIDPRIDEKPLISIYDVSGRLVVTLYHNAEDRPDQTPDCIRWDGCNDRGARVSSGVYFVRLTHGNARMSEKVLLIR
jgi:hypothetical protein